MAATITVVCPHCRNRMRASIEHVGRKGRCPACSNLLEIKVSESASYATLHPDASSAEADRGRRAISASEVNTWLAALFGAVATGLLYIPLLLLHRSGSRLGVFMYGQIQASIMFVTCWGVIILVMKYRAVQQQSIEAARELELIPLDIGLTITPSNVESFLGHLLALPVSRAESVLARRIRGALEHFKFRNSVPEVQEYLATQAEIDASGVDSGYILLRAFIWVCPILGFIGTVIGLSSAIQGMNLQLAPAPVASGNPDPSGLEMATSGSSEDATQAQFKAAMSQVTSGLATAFDTTLLGLVCTVVLLFPTEILRKMEYGVLDRIEGFANESLLRRMSEGATLDKDPARYAREALEQAFRQHQQWLAEWQEQVGKMGLVIANQIQTEMAGIRQEVVKSEVERLERLERLSKKMQQIAEVSARSVSEAQTTANRLVDGIREIAGPIVTQLRDCSQQFEQALRNQAELIQQPGDAKFDELRPVDLDPGRADGLPQGRAFSDRTLDGPFAS